MKFMLEDHLLLCNFDVTSSDKQQVSDKNIEKIWNGDFTSIFKDPLVRSLLETQLTTTEVKTVLDSVYSSEDQQRHALTIAVTCLVYFCKINWTGLRQDISLQEVLGCNWPNNIKAVDRLQSDSEEIDVNIRASELFLLAKEILNVLCLHEEKLIYLWWQLRCKITHQKILEDSSPTIYADIELVTSKLSNGLSHLHEYPRLQVLLHTEIGQAHLMYGRVQRTEHHLEKAKEIAGVKLELKGLLGKRTKFQQESKAQLVLATELDESVSRPSAESTHGVTELPKLIELNDDVRLNKIEFTEISNVGTEVLPSLEQVLCLLTVQHLQRSQPKDNLADEELLPFINSVLIQSTGAWTSRVAALLTRCKLESNNKRTVERAMMQCESLVNELDSMEANSVNRLSYLWASGLSPSWKWWQQLADLYLSLGLVKSALEEYIKLQLWEDVIVCYTVLEMRHKAAEVIQQQIDVNPTVKLYCLMGDATDSISWYEKAWEISKHKSSRAQRHWGNHLFLRTKYEECIPHFQKSVEINSIQDKIWLRLGYAALMLENWDLAATAYRRYTYLEPNTFEAWNNLAKIYVKQGDKKRAHKALIEALRFNYDSWKLWENVLAVSIDTGHFDDVVRGYHRLLDIKGKHLDLEVISLLVRAIVENKLDSEGNPSIRLQKKTLELMGRITSLHPTEPDLWQFYADISPTTLLKSQRLQKAYAGFTQGGSWSKNPVTCQKVVSFAETLLETSLQARKEADDSSRLQADQQLSSARLTGQGVIRAAEKEDWPEVQVSLQQLKSVFDSVMAFLKSS